MRTSGDPIADARLMPSRSSLTERSNSLSSLRQHGAAAGPQPQAGARRRVLHRLPVRRIVDARVDGILQKDRVQFQRLAYSINCRSFQRSARIEYVL